MVNTAPVLDGLNSKVTFAENTINLGPQLIDVDVSFSDAENNFFPGSLTISGGLSEDVLGIRIRDSGPARSASSATPSPIPARPLRLFPGAPTERRWCSPSWSTPIR